MFFLWSLSDSKSHQISCIIIIIFIIIYTESSLHVLADGFSLESEWQQVPSSLQDSSKYSGRSQ